MAAHRYWRVYITAVQSAGYVACMELAMYTAVGGSTVCSGGTASASSDGFGWVVGNAFDGSTTGTGWHSGTNNLPTTPEWIKYDFGSGNDKDIIEFAYSHRPGFDTTSAPKDFALQWSDDNSAWTSLYTLTGETSWGQTSFNKALSETRKYPTASKQAWRINCSATETNTGVGIGEIEFHSSNGGAQLCSGGQAKASGVYSTGYEPETALDGGNLYWNSGTAPPHWWSYRFNSTTPDVVEYKIKSSLANYNQAPKTWTLQYWDGSAWVTADTQTTVANWTSHEIRTYNGYNLQTATITPSGGMTFAGTNTGLRNCTKTPSGGLTLAGAAAMVKGFRVTPGGGLSFSGSVSCLRNGVITPTGGLLIRGNGQRLVFYTVELGGGGVTFAGSAAMAQVKALLATGGCTISGTGGPIRIQVNSPSGGLLLAGDTTQASGENDPESDKHLTKQHANVRRQQGRR